MPTGIYIRSADQIRKARENHVKGSKHPLWKGDSVGKSALHKWLNRTYGSPKYCVDCRTTKESTRYHWANISGKYRRSIHDYKRLCSRCHSAFDFKLRPKGEKQGSAKLTASKVKRIWEMWEAGKYTHKRLGVIFGVARPTITSILTRRNWKDSNALNA